ncbi:MAG: GTPase HflX [Treponema sp.]|jgi:GTP-binding protein HflX|nr:GTPase HflX [Treponema sp.]
MIPLFETGERPERVLLVGIRNTLMPKDEADSLTRELAGLAESLGMEIAARETVLIRKKHPQFGMGTGKVRELAARAASLEADCLVFDGELSPSQQRNWEKLTGISAVDRQELIIQIFAGRAKTREAELQAALAELNYSLPRLQHKYTALSRQRGGRYGSKGSGEAKLETDRRLVEQRIHRLKEELAGVRRNRAVRRKKREKTLPSCALVGYTNAGKSSLLNALTGAGVPAEDRLFATLDAVTRRLEPAGGRPFLVTDTVGFIRRLPHTLVDAFRSTLEEVTLADLLVHVLDVSDPDADRYQEAVMGVLRELGADRIPMITVLNKKDRLSPEDLAALERRFPGGIPVSAAEGSGLDRLVRRMERMLPGGSVRFSFPPDRYDLAALLHRDGTVLSERYAEEAITIEARVDAKTLGQLKAFRDG